ncbi:MULTISPECIES: nicotinate (nicotinamide) nucleotide adenylyltransferase [Hydrogenophaga]|uniref:Probable nicotinate-nucleotide adenylyltransferase n=1 Tax=Hydrogenophaga intermedia TaxID=65786 RepID=A0A1L1PFT2_HYDIT|nr:MULTISPECIES: nicotinate (nicotinamide) nucleotide adenylyltransferase [Hydrogenophaga]AOS79457.1 nicotinate (nicotinamide) nucleotide adenylyltransferase [Hydrogenophaga sp. PBC]TMU77004.1 nicotinate (nicotinamide) nucleotide adenylyltransferase [Hydrogenophaga intermedia]CDN86629.1 putative nicotinate-nucleotide adenylyltransferase [Hydrogenophaga intermedia]
MASATRPIQRVGMFGGAFDPPHTAHRALAQAALEQLGLDVLHVMPTGQAWHKARTLSAARHRIAMCEAAFGDLPRVRIDRRETGRHGPSYTADTLAELRAEYPQATLYLVLGADQLLAFKSWVRWEEVLSLATLAVANRPTNIGAQALRGDAPLTDLSGVDLPFVPLCMPLQHISATALRAKLATEPADDPSLDLLVPDAVASYISQNHLYQTPT